MPSLQSGASHLKAQITLTRGAESSGGTSSGREARRFGAAPLRFIGKTLAGLGGTRWTGLADVSSLDDACARGLLERFLTVDPWDDIDGLRDPLTDVVGETARFGER